VASALAEQGLRVAVARHSNVSAAEATANEIARKGGEAKPARLDQSSAKGVAAGVAEVEATLGPVDTVVAAAVAWPEPGPEDWDSITQGLVTNVVGSVVCVEQVLPGMRNRGWGRVVVISTDLVDRPLPIGTAYPAAKGALEAAARVWALREAPKGILTNVVRPGFTLTEKVLRTPCLGHEAVEAEAARTPTGRICTPADVANVVAFLATDRNSHVNGETMSVGGGRALT
jgi:3-oxoacyl-[acyl-carrier protein] reductase